jgi:hypothetical protein
MDSSAAMHILRPDGTLAGRAPDLAPERLRDLWVHMLRVRCIDQRMLKLQRAGRVGFVGTALGLAGAMIGSAAICKTPLACTSRTTGTIRPCPVSIAMPRSTRWKCTSSCASSSSRPFSIGCFASPSATAFMMNGM